MRASFEDINSKKGNHSFLVYHYNVPAFEFKWHYHPEYELTLITKGKGKRLVGDSYENFETGDLVLIGPDMPHTWVSDRLKRSSSSAVVIQFSEKFIQSFLQHSEFNDIKKLLLSSARGLYFPGNNKKIADDIRLLPCRKGMERITHLLTILQQLSRKHSVTLTSPYFSPVKGMENEKRINKVCQYVQKHYRENISLQKTASLLHLSDAAFCKFFKKATGKTFSDYVNDIRIGNACSLLTESDKPISAIAFNCGFESLTYFNRVFLKKKGSTPRQFRNSVLQFA